MRVTWNFKTMKYRKGALNISCKGRNISPWHQNMTKILFFAAWSQFFYFFSHLSLDDNEAKNQSTLCSLFLEFSLHIECYKLSINTQKSHFLHWPFFKCFSHIWRNFYETKPTLSFLATSLNSIQRIKLQLINNAEWTISVDATHFRIIYMARSKPNFPKSLAPWNNMKLNIHFIFWKIRKISKIRYSRCN